jgi:hypothetical protein
VRSTKVSQSVERVRSSVGPGAAVVSDDADRLLDTATRVGVVA